MTDLDFTFIGTGNAFSPGGLCCSGFLVNRRFLFDAPPHSLSSLRRVEVDPNEIEAIVLSHHHGDHFLGVPFLLLHWRWKGRTRPVRIIGPRGTAALTRDITQKVFPGVFENTTYDLEIEELAPGGATSINGLSLDAHQMIHDSELDICLGYAARLDDRRFAYTGDTTLCDSVYKLAKGQEVMVSECASWSDQVPVHMNFVDDIPHVRAALPAEATLILTHVNMDVARGAIDLPNTLIAEDYKTYRL
jgi:ribonuclease BN (tRNA processing enzyme)